jgi:hypothetical protein
MKVTVEFFAVQFESPACILSAAEMVATITRFVGATNRGPTLPAQKALQISRPIHSGEYVLPKSINDFDFRAILSTVIMYENLTRPSLESK